MDPFEFYCTKALRFLSFRPRSEKEVRDFFNKKKVDPQIIEKIINFLKEKNFINDQKFVAWWIEQRTTFKPRSLRLIKMELQQKGIADELIEFPISNDKEQAIKLIERKIEKYKDLPKYEIYQKLGPFLARKGFNYDTIKASIDEILTKGV